MDEILNALDMGKYAQYVWPSFGMTFLVMLIEPIMIQLRRKTILRQLRRLYQKTENEL